MLNTLLAECLLRYGAAARGHNGTESQMALRSQRPRVLRGVFVLRFLGQHLCTHYSSGTLELGGQRRLQQAGEARRLGVAAEGGVEEVQAVADLIERIQLVQPRRQPCGSAAVSY